MKKKSLYMIILGLCLMSYGWLFLNWQTQSTAATTTTLCVFKNISGIPCPSCGTTRSVMSIYEGNIKQAIMYNPLGIIAAFILIFTPLWLAYDFILEKSTLQSIYHKMELLLKNKFIAFPLILLVLSNWIWNIMKGL